MILSRNSKQTLLAVLAHPDDESFGMGGTLALYSQRGVTAQLVCATRGEVGEVDPKYLDGFSSIAELREHELRCAAQNLGLSGVYFLGYRDSGMTGSAENRHPQALAAAPIDEVTERIVHHIRLLRPQVVLTFDPIGGYRHPDHIAVHNATVRAFHAAGDPNITPGDLAPYQPQKLYYHTISRRLLRFAVRMLPLFGRNPRKWGQNHDIDLTSLAIEDFPVHAIIDFKPVMARKMEASICHASQGGKEMANGLMSWMIRLSGNKETFMRAYPPPEPSLREKDLFAGVIEEAVSVSEFTE